MKSKYFKIFFIIFSLFFLLLSIRNNALMYITEFQHSLIKNFMKTIRKGDKTWLLICFLYGMLHSLGPGHGKTFLLTLSTKYNKKMLILFSAIIVYSQALISFLIISLIFKNKIINSMTVHKIDRITLLFYLVILVFLIIYEIIHEFLEKKQKGHFFLIGAFFPCAGILSLLVVVKMLGLDNFIIPTTLFMSTGMFLTLIIFSIFLDKFKYSCSIFKNKIKYINISLYLLILFYALYRVIF